MVPVSDSRWQETRGKRLLVQGKCIAAELVKLAAELLGQLKEVFFLFRPDGFRLRKVESERVAVCAVHLEFIMQVRSGSKARLTDVADDLTLFHITAVADFGLEA